jgi:hypothetical protein
MLVIFTRTFVELWTPYVAAAVLAAEIANYRLTVEQLVIGAVVALIGGGVALLIAWRTHPAGTRLEKALRSAAEKAIAVLGTLTVTTLADIIALHRVLVPGAIGVVGAFAITWLMNPATDPPPAPA